MTSSQRWAVMLVVAIWGLGQTARAESIDELLNYIPDRANAILVVDAEAILKTPVAIRENWARKREQDYLAGVTSLPPTVHRLVIGAQLEPSTLENAWEVGVVEKSDPVSVLNLAKTVGGSLDTVNDFPVVAGPANAFYVQLGPQLGAMYKPANRQELSRWLRSVKAKRSGGLVEYLKDAAEQVGKESQIVMALEVAQMLDVPGIRKRLENNPSLTGKTVDLDNLAQTIADLEGIRLTIHIDEAITGKLELQFAGPTAALAPYAKDLILTAADRLGAHIDDLQQWQARASSKTIILEGPLSTAGMQLILSPMLSPAALMPAASSQGGGDSKLVATQKYFNSVKSLIAQLRKEKLPGEKSFMEELGFFFEKYSKRIDELPVLNVDEEMLQYGNAVSATFRQFATAYRSSAQTFATLEQTKGSYNVQYGNPGVYNTGYNAYTGWGGYSYYDPGSINVTNVAVNSLTQVSMTKQLNAAKKQLWSQLDALTGAMRKRMSLKYNVEF